MQVVGINSQRDSLVLRQVGGQQAVAAGGVVTTAFSSATEAARDTLQAGGNAIDAAVAAAWALAVCEPSGSGLGGQTTLLIYFPTGKTAVIDGHSYAPAAVSRKRVTGRQQKKGYRASTIPSTPATLAFAQKRYGVLPHAQVMEPAIRLAEDGYIITKLQRRQTSWCLTDLRASSATERLFLKKRRPFKVGAVFRQEKLAATLRRLADCGIEDFYHGKIARAIAKDMKEFGGLITRADLAGCTLPVERQALSVNYHGYEVVSIPPPGGGLQILLGLKLLEQLVSADLPEETDGWYEALAEVIHAVFRERDRFPIHPRDLTPSLYKWLLSGERACEIAKAIRGDGAELAGHISGEGPGETTHLCAADRHGNVVALTQSIQSLFGAKVANYRLGFLYNNYLSTCPRRRHPYQLGRRCMPRSNAAPTLVLENGAPSSEGLAGDRGHYCKPFLVLGAAGSRRITSVILQVISSVIDRGISLEEAVDSPRVHVLPGRKVNLERRAANESLLRKLEKRFRKINVKASHSYSMGVVQAIGFGKDGSMVGVADPRRDGTALGV